MLREKEFAVYGDNGLKGTLLSAARFLDPSPEKRVRLEDGRVIVVPSHALIAQPDGSYYFHQTEAEAAGNPASAAAVATPEVRRSESAYQPPPPEAELQRERSAAERERVVENQRSPQLEPDRQQGHAAEEPRQPPRQVFAPSAAGPLFREDCDVQRVEVKRIIDKPVEIRQDGDTLIIPLMEEVLVVERRLMLREELHIKRRRDAKAPSDRVPIAQEQLAR